MTFKTLIKVIVKDFLIGEGNITDEQADKLIKYASAALDLFVLLVFLAIFIFFLNFALSFHSCSDYCRLLNQTIVRNLS